jgi:hypothetical protein
MDTLRHRAFILTSLFCMVCLASLANATTIVLVRSGETLYLAADSRRITGAGRPTQKIGEACKIRVRGGLVMAAAGLVDFPDLPALPGGLSIDRAFARASESWSASSSLREKNARFIDRAIAEVRPYWQKLVSLPGARERGWLAQAVVQTVLVGVDGDAPVAIVTLLVPVISSDVVSVEPRDFPFPESAPGVILGISTAFNRLSLLERRRAFALPGLEAARRFVEAEFVSSRVGPPVNVVEISSGGIRWIDQSSKCAVLNRSTSAPR